MARSSGPGVSGTTTCRVRAGAAGVVRSCANAYVHTRGGRDDRQHRQGRAPAGRRPARPGQPGRRGSRGPRRPPPRSRAGGRPPTRSRSTARPRWDGSTATSRCWSRGPGPPFGSRQRRTVRVRVWGEGDDDEPSAWSAPVEIEAGLLDRRTGRARFVSPAGDGAVDEIPPSPLLRKDFTIDGPVAQARLYVSALGLYEVEINGRPVGDQVLAPGWTSYGHRLRYETTTSPTCCSRARTPSAPCSARAGTGARSAGRAAGRNILRRPPGPAGPARDRGRRRLGRHRRHRRHLAHPHRADRPERDLRRRDRTTPGSSSPAGRPPGFDDGGRMRLGRRGRAGPGP
jgi:hypothetical protein